MAISGVTKPQHPLANLPSPVVSVLGLFGWSSVWGGPTVPEPLIGPVWVPIDVSHLRNPGHHGLKRLKDVSTCEESAILDPADTVFVDGDSALEQFVMGQPLEWEASGLSRKVRFTHALFGVWYGYLCLIPQPRGKSPRAG